MAKGVNESIAKLLLVDKKYKMATAWFAAVARDESEKDGVSIFASMQATRGAVTYYGTASRVVCFELLQGVSALL